VHPNADDEALEKMAQSGQEENIFIQQSVMSVTTRHTVNAILEEAKETKADLENLEQNMNELLRVHKFLRNSCGGR
jgi:t-SNARE complex subunit (syntaxin)